MYSSKSKKTLFICAVILLVGYAFHLWKMVREMQPSYTGSWGFQHIVDFISVDDYLPVSIGKADQLLSLLTWPNHLMMKKEPLMKMVDFPLATLLMGLTLRYSKDRTGRKLLIALYLFFIAFSLFVLPVERHWLRTETSISYNSQARGTASALLIPWCLQAVLPKLILVIVSITALVALWRGKVVEE